MRRVHFVLILLLFPIAVAESQSGKRVRRVRVSEAQLLLKRERVEKFQTINEIQKAVVSGLLYPIPSAGVLYSVGHLPIERRFCRPYSLSFMQDLAAEMIDSLSKRLLVTSCIRDEKAQARLRRTSKSAAPVKGKSSTAHYSGAAVDISFRSVDLATGKIVKLSKKELGMVTRALARRKRNGLLVYKTESAKNHWHVVVSKKYQPLPEKTAMLTPIDFYNAIFRPEPR